MTCRCAAPVLLAVTLVLWVFAPSAFAEEDVDGPTPTQLALLHERWWAWEPAAAERRPTEIDGPIDWVKLQFSGAKNQTADWMEDGGFSLLKDRDPYGSSRYTVATGALTTKWASFHFRARVGRPEMSAGLRPRRHAPAFGVTVPWDRFVFELEALDDKDFGYSILSGLRWSPAHQRVQYGLALPVSVGDGPSAAAILQILIRLDDSH